LRTLFRFLSSSGFVGNLESFRSSRVVFLSLLTTLPLFSAAPDFTYTYRYTTYTNETTDNLTVFTGTGGTPPLNNKQMGCISWQLLYNSNGLSGISVNLQSAPSGQGGAVGTWSTFSGTNATGSASLPMTTVNSSGAFVSWGYFPWIRVNVATLTGTGAIDIQLSCWKSVLYAGGLGGGGGTLGGDLSGTTGNATVAKIQGTPIIPNNVIYQCISASGSASAYTCTTGSSVTLANYQQFLWSPDTSNSAGATLNVDGNGAYNVYGYSGTTLVFHEVFGFTPGILLTYYSGAFYIIGENITLKCATNGAIIINAGNSPDSCSANNLLYNDQIAKLSALQGNQIAGAPAISGACSTTIGSGSTNIAGFFTTTTAGTCAFTLTWTNSITYGHGAICSFDDVTTVAALFTGLMHQTGYSTTTVTGTGTTASGDTVYYSCIGF
jgi:hypothetical protein